MGPVSACKIYFVSFLKYIVGRVSFYFNKNGWSVGALRIVIIIFYWVFLHFTVQYVKRNGFGCVGDRDSNTQPCPVVAVGSLASLRIVT